MLESTSLSHLMSDESWTYLDSTLRMFRHLRYQDGALAQVQGCLFKLGCQDNNFSFKSFIQNIVY